MSCTQSNSSRMTLRKKSLINESVVMSFLSAPTFDYGDMPSPLSETDSTITVLLRPAQGRGAPVR